MPDYSKYSKPMLQTALRQRTAEKVRLTKQLEREKGKGTGTLQLLENAINDVNIITNLLSIFTKNNCLCSLRYGYSIKIIHIL